MRGEITSRVVSTAHIKPQDRAALSRLLEASYDGADDSYLDESLRAFSWLALAECDGEVVGFSFGGVRRAELPGLDGRQQVALAGIACVDERLRELGLFTSLTRRAMSTDGLDPNRPFLFAGRMAHAVTYRTAARMANNVVPAPGQRLSAWHLEVAVCVVALLECRLEGYSMVVRGDGRPVGTPRIAYQATAEEEALFAGVDRGRGDSLLTMCWFPNAPAGW